MDLIYVPNHPSIIHQFSAVCSKSYNLTHTYIIYASQMYSNDIMLCYIIYTILMLLEIT